MESINELLEDENIDETFYARSPRYNLAIFSIILYTIIEFLYPDNSILAWLAFASAAATLGVLNDFILKDYNILLNQNCFQRKWKSDLWGNFLPGTKAPP